MTANLAKLVRNEKNELVFADGREQSASRLVRITDWIVEKNYNGNNILGRPKAVAYEIVQEDVNADGNSKGHFNKITVYRYYFGVK